MRSTYGKLIYILQDSPQSIEFSVKKDLVTVHSFLSARGGLELLEDEDLGVATLSVAAERGAGEGGRADVAKVSGALCRLSA